MGGTLNTVLKIETKQATWNLNGAGITVKGLEMTGAAAGTTTLNFNGVGTNFNGNFIGVDISGKKANGTSNTINVNAANSIIGSNEDSVLDDSESQYYKCSI